MARIGNAKLNYSPNDSLYTPTWIFEKLNTRFDLDPAHPNYDTNVPTNNYYTEQQDGLIQKWFGFVWLNPPFSCTSKWAQKFIEHQNGIMLVPLSKSKWFWQVWDAADAIAVIPNNLKFEKTHGKTQTIFMPTCLVAMGEKAVQVLTNSGIGRVR